MRNINFINKISLGDCLELLPNIEDKSIDMILCDLPYAVTNCHWDSLIDLDALWSEYKRVIKDNGAIVFTAIQPFTSRLINSNPSWFKYSWVWEKSKATGFLNAKKRPLVAHEDVLVFYKKQPTYNPQFTIGESYNKGVRKKQTSNDVYKSFEQAEVKSEGKRYPRSVQYFKTAESEGETFHKSQKPLSLFEYLIKTYTIEGETVLDNCIGSGTTALACVNNKRNFIGFEKESEYHLIANSRLQKVM
jgi:site-specific DNA-methyltransferase (adenine-specific)